MDPLSIGFIGLGKMGLPMARQLLKSGYRLRVYNRDQKKMRDLVADGAIPASRPCDVLEDADIVITMVSNDRALEEIVHGEHGLFSHLVKGVIHLSMSTIAPTTSQKLAKEHQAKGAIYLAAPVSGRPEGAMEGKLWIFLSGENQAKEKVKPVLSAMGQRTFDLGEKPENANVFKLANNFLILSCVEALSEAFAYAEKNGLSSQLVGEIFTESLFSCPVYRTYAPIISKRKFSPAGFSLELGLKDFELLKESAKDLFEHMPFAKILHKHLLTAKAEGWQDMDWSSIARLNLR